MKDFSMILTLLCSLIGSRTFECLCLRLCTSLLYNKQWINNLRDIHRKKFMTIRRVCIKYGVVTCMSGWIACSPLISTIDLAPKFLLNCLSFYMFCILTTYRQKTDLKNFKKYFLINELYVEINLFVEFERHRGL